MTSLVFPLGRMIGTFHDGDDPAARHHEIRRGGAIHELTDADLAGWAFAHGPADPEAPETWTRAAVETHLGRLGMPEPAAILAALLARDLLVEVDPATAGAVAFARSHQAIPMLYGLGNSAEEPWRFGIGLLGQELIQVSRPVFELWAWAHLDGDLWRACETFAEQERGAGGSEPEVTDPSLVLSGFLHSVHGLLNVQALYLDTKVGQR